MSGLFQNGVSEYPDAVPFEVPETIPGLWITLFLALVLFSAVLSFAGGAGRRVASGKGALSKGGLIMSGSITVVCAIFGTPIIHAITHEDIRVERMQEWVSSSYGLTVNEQEASALYNEDETVIVYGADGVALEVMLMAPDGIWRDGNAGLLVNPVTRVPLGWESNPILEARMTPEVPVEEPATDVSAEPVGAQGTREATMNVCLQTVEAGGVNPYDEEAVAENCETIIADMEQEISQRTVPDLTQLLATCRAELVPVLMAGGDAADLPRLNCMTVEHVLTELTTPAEAEEPAETEEPGEVELPAEATATPEPSPGSTEPGGE